MIFKNRKIANSPLLITNAVRAIASVDTKLVDSGNRASLARAAILKIIDSKFFDRIVVVDGSGFNLLSDEDRSNSLINGIEIEQLSFLQDSSKVIAFGKGQGEMQILRYAIKNSEILRKSKSFYKLSGRYFLSNFDELLPYTEKYPSMFFNYNPRFCFPNSQFTCTAFYKCSFYAYENYINHAIDYCSLQRDGRLESAFFKVLGDSDYLQVASPFPKFEGIGGTLGAPLKNRFFSARNIYSKLGGLAYVLKDDQ